MEIGAIAISVALYNQVSHTLKVSAISVAPYIEKNIISVIILFLLTELV